MKIKLLAYFIGVLTTLSCESKKDLTLIRAENKLDSEIYIELWGYPAKGYQNNKAGAFHEIIDSDSSFIIEMNDSHIYKKTNDLSPVYESSEYEGFEVVIYKPIGEEIEIYGDTPKDTLYFERFDLKYLTDNRPKLIKIE
jgi:hypothetical protein